MRPVTIKQKVTAAEEAQYSGIPPSSQFRLSPDVQHSSQIYFNFDPLRLIDSLQL
jgi:hypothetical protein